MFVRKGTLRKGRGNSSRASGRRNRNHHQEKISHIRTTAFDNCTESSCVQHQDIGNYKDNRHEAHVPGSHIRHETYGLNSNFDRSTDGHGVSNTYIERFQEAEATPKSSPARSLATTVTVS